MEYHLNVNIKFQKATNKKSNELNKSKCHLNANCKTSWQLTSIPGWFNNNSIDFFLLNSAAKLNAVLSINLYLNSKKILKIKYHKKEIS